MASTIGKPAEAVFFQASVMLGVFFGIAFDGDQGQIASKESCQGADGIKNDRHINLLC
ncbi:hypothetical protein LVC68_11245 [Melaminivora jejuensis]|uniref:hypothetical protein n=1 Tax=Melaminivora jejuensis TaxID=1267217 RepID=UPI001E5BE689|nr:hypothetical protein [Melaminivora jejuensis]UHJ63959.1 hypothetical protein LVC68_11245 [Melaminivora jejuensis]